MSPPRSSTRSKTRYGETGKKGANKENGSESSAPVSGVSSDSQVN